MQTIVIGHKNPDMDSICAALAYARLKEVTGMQGVVAGRCGNTNERIDFVLEKFGVEAPHFFSNVSPTVADIMDGKVVTIHSGTTVYDAVNIVEQRRLPVVDSDRRCLGLLSAFKINRHLFPPRDQANAARRIHTSLQSITTTFGGKTITGHLSEEMDDLILMIGAMEEEAFGQRIPQYDQRKIVLLVGNRVGIQLLAIAAHVRAIVVTSGYEVSDAIKAAAEKAEVPIISSPHDTATTILLARGAVTVQEMLDTQFESFTLDTPVNVARELAAASPAFVFPVIDEDGRLAGVLSKSDFIKPVQRQLILVDHNELSQAVDGADKVPIVEILDHHKLGGFATNAPILFWNNPVGSTSTIVALSYQAAGISIPREIAGLLMAGLITDTLNLTSPTTTPTDRTILAKLSQITRIDPATLANEIFSVGSPLLTMSPEQAINSDCKEYVEDGATFTVAQIEELSFAHFAEKEGALLEALQAQVDAQKLYFAALLVTDINTQMSILLVAGAPEFRATIDYPERATPQTWEMAGVVSRKKQLLPYLLQCLARAQAAAAKA